MTRTRLVAFVLIFAVALAVSGITPGLIPISCPGEHPIPALTTAHDTEDGSGVLPGSLGQDWLGRASDDRAFLHHRQHIRSPGACTAARSSAPSSALLRESPTAAGF